MPKENLIDPECPPERRAEQDAFNRRMGHRTRKKILLAALRNAGAEPATVYWASDTNGIILYVGQSANLDQRMRQHARGSIWWYRAASIGNAPCSSRAAALRLEYMMIEHRRPEFNELYEDDRYGQGY